MTDYRELMALFLPGGVDLASLGIRGQPSDVRQMLCGALSAVEPPWAADLLRARYADDTVARRRVERGLLIECTKTYRAGAGHKPGTLSALAWLALVEHIEPTKCAECAGTGMEWALQGGAVTQCDCPACRGQGRVAYTDAQRADVVGDDWSAWRDVYGGMLRTLRAWEAAAVLTLSEQMRPVACAA